MTALAQATLFEARDRARVTVVAPIVGSGVLWTVVFAAAFLASSTHPGPSPFATSIERENRR